MQFNTIYIPYEGRAKYPDSNPSQVVMQSGNGGGGSIVGGVGSTEYMTAFQTDTNAGTWNVSGITSLTSISDGTAILVRFNTDSNSALTANTINIGLPAGEDSGQTYPYPIYLQSGKLVTDEIKAGDELMITYRDNVSGWTIDASNERFMREVWHKLGSGTVISQYTVASSGDVLSYGESSHTGWTELSVIDNLTTDREPHTNYALSANMGKELNDKLLQLSGSTITEFKTINGASIIGQGNIEIQGGSGTGGTFVVGSGLTYDNATGEYRVADSVFEAIDSKYDKTGGYVSGSVIASGDVISYGESDFTGLSLTVINNLASNSTTDALSANMGRTLSGMVNGKQDELVSGENIKTINGQSLLGSGNIVIQGGGGGTEYNEGSGISITNSTISVSGPLFAEIYSKANSAGTYTGLTVGSAASATTSESATTAGDSARLGGSAATEFAKISAMNEALDLKYDKTGGTVNGSVHAIGTVSADGDVLSYGASSIVPTGITVIQDLIHSANTTENVLAARQGYLLNQNKQDKLVSGQNIKTINGNSLLGSGNIIIEGGGGGTSYVGGTNISISNGTISVTGRVESASTSLTAVTAENASKLGNVAASGYLTTGGTAYDSNRLGGKSASSYAQTAGTYSQLAVGTAGRSDYATYLGTSTNNYTKSSLDTALNGKLGTGATAADSSKLGGTAASGYLKTGDTATNSTKWAGYNIVVGSTGTAANTIYFGY